MRSIGDRPVVTVLAADIAEKPEEKPQRGWNAPRLRKTALIAAVLIWAVAITGIVIFRGAGGGSRAPAAARPSASPTASAAPLTVAQIYQTVLPSLVSIRSTGKAGSSSPARSMTESSTGTGVIANADGTILTANHVIAGAVAITVTYTDGATAAAEV